MDSRAGAIILAAATLGLPSMALGESHARAQLDHSGAEYARPLQALRQGLLQHEQTSVASGIVTAIDPRARLVTLRTEGGQIITVRAGDGVRNLDTLGAGDLVKATCTESVVFQVVPKAQALDDSSRSMGNIGGDSRLGQKVTSSFTVVSVDPTANVLEVRLPGGKMKQVHFEEPAQSRLQSLNPGDVIAATHTSSAIRLEKLANQN